MSSLSSVMQLAAALRANEVSAEALVGAALERIHSLDGELHAFVATFDRAALAAARRVDWARRRGREVPVLAGVPIAVKDQVFVAGHATRFGSRAQVALPSPVDDVLVRRLRRAGFIIVGSTSMSEMGAIPVTENLIGPWARNPFDVSRTPGGSSGGSGAAVAAGMVPLAHGSDGGGSLRIPSALCGLFTLKPTRGTLPNNHGRDPSRSLYIDGPIATTALDVAVGLDVLMGRPRPAELVAASQRLDGPLKVKLCVTSALGPVDSALVEAARRVATALHDLGHHVEEVLPPALGMADFLPLWQRLIANTPLFSPQRAHPYTAWLYREGQKLDRGAIWKAHLAAQATVDAWCEPADLVITPTTAITAPPVGLGATEDPLAASEAFAPLVAFTAPFNVTGRPAASVPVGLSSAGLPLGVQLAGRRGADALVLAACRMLEETGVARAPVSPRARPLVPASPATFPRAPAA